MMANLSYKYKTSLLFCIEAGHLLMLEGFPRARGAGLTLGERTGVLEAVLSTGFPKLTRLMMVEGRVEGGIQHIPKGAYVRASS